MATPKQGAVLGRAWDGSSAPSRVGGEAGAAPPLPKRLRPPASLAKCWRLRPYALRERTALLWILALTVGSSAAAALQPWPLKLLVDHALGGGAVDAGGFPALDQMAPVALVTAAALASIAVFVVGAALDAGIAWASGSASQRMTYDLAGDMFRHLQRMTPMAQSRRPVGDSLDRLTTDAWCVYKVTNALLLAPAQNALTLIIIGMVAWFLDPVLALISVAVVPIVTSGAAWFGERFRMRARVEREAASRLTAFAQQTIAAVPVVQAFSSERRNRTRFQQLSADAVAQSQRSALLTQQFSLANRLAMALSTSAVLYVGGLKVLAGQMPLGSLLVFLTYLVSINRATHGLLNVFRELKAAEASVDRVLEIMDEADDEVREVPGAAALPRPAAGRGIHVRLEGITFGYEPGRTVLKEVTLEARPGETVGLVGPTGAGKTTLVSLIPRLFDPWQGCVTFDGRNVREATLASLRAQVGLVLQDPYLLPLSVAENIAYGRPEAERAEIEAAAAAANADGFVRRLAEGYDTLIGERGATLSGGEKQRIAIARALLKDAPVLILDEPTSALDAETEGLLLEALERLMEGRTTFVIAHRLSTIRNADRIVVLEDGRMTESGTHDELMLLGGPYACALRARLRFAEPEGAAAAAAYSTGADGPPGGNGRGT